MSPLDRTIASRNDGAKRSRQRAWVGFPTTILVTLWATRVADDLVCGALALKGGRRLRTELLGESQVLRETAPIAGRPLGIHLRRQGGLHVDGDPVGMGKLPAMPPRARWTESRAPPLRISGSPHPTSSRSPAADAAWMPCSGHRGASLRVDTFGGATEGNFRGEPARLPLRKQCSRSHRAACSPVRTPSRRSRRSQAARRGGGSIRRTASVASSIIPSAHRLAHGQPR